MSIAALDPGNRPILSVPFLFDVEGHKLSLETFYRTSQEYERLIEAFNQELFEGDLQYKLYVFAPSPGSFKSTLGVVVIAGLGALTATMLGDLGSGFVKGLTGKPAIEWGEELGERLRNELEDLREEEVSDEDVENAIATEIFVKTSERFLEGSTRELREVGITPDDYPSMFNAKNDFFEVLEHNPQVKSISFGDEPLEPIARDLFGLRVTPVKSRNETTWEFETKKYFVTSPNWDQFDGQRGWKGRDGKGSIVFFTILDPNFWLRFDNHEIRSDTIDELIVQVATKFEDGKRKGRYVLNVISYNDDRLNPEFSQDELYEQLLKHGLADEVDSSDDLFE